jgi:hypothetical protein
MEFRVKFKESDIKNLAVFLDRVELKGQEVSAFVRIQNAVLSAEKISSENTKEPKNLQDMKSKGNDGISVAEVD